VGRLDRRVNNYNVFVVDKYTKWLHGVPEFLKDELDMDDDSRIQVRGDALEYDEQEKDRIEADSDINQHLDEIEDDRATIKQGSEFELIAELIEKGELPFTPQPVSDEDLREPEVNFELRDYQKEGFDTFTEQGHACFCWMTGAGKSFPSMYALDSLRYDEDDAKKAVVVQSRLTKQQWNQYFEEFAPRLKDEVEVVTYQGMDDLQGEYILIVYDEAHVLPADTFSKGATIPTKYRIGTTASPYREDDRQNYVFALTGPPVGLDWEKTANLMDKTYHEINVHIVDDKREKISRIQSILDDVGDKRTFVFSDSLDFGEEISEATGLNFVNGEDTKQLEKIKENRQVIVSRIADHGVSVDDLEVVLEADFLFGSRRQQIQRTGRLFHGEGKRHDIFFTRGEFNKYQKRLYSLIEKGFDLNFVDHEEEIEVPDKYQSRVDLDMENRGEKVDRGDETVSSQSSVGEGEFLEHPKIQEQIKKAIQDYNRVKNEMLKEVLVEVDLSENGLTNEEISERLGNPSYEDYRLTSGFRNHEPPILVQDGEKRNQFNTELLDELKEVEERRKRREKRKKQLDF
jgi:DNA excision repair protein ERCC-3